MMANMPKDYEYPAFQDGYITLIAAIFFSVTEVYIIRPILLVMFRPFCKE